MNASGLNKLGSVVGGLALLGLGLLMILLLPLLTSFEFVEVGRQLRRTRLPYAGLIVLSSALHFAMTALKWRWVTQQIRPDVSFRGGFFIYTAIIGFMSQFLPMQLCVLTGRSLAMRLQLGLPLVTGALSTVYDQFFDFLVPVVLLAPAVLAMLCLVDPTTGLLLSLVCLAVTGVALGALGGRVVLLLLWLGRLVPGLDNRAARMTEQIQASDGPALLDRRFMAKLFCLSVVRYANLVLRPYCVLVAVGLDFGFAPVAFATTVVTLSVIISITPGSLGIAEWSWISVLATFGVPAAVAGEFAILTRLFILSSVLVVNLTLVPIMVVLQRFRSAQCDHPPNDHC